MTKFYMVLEVRNINFKMKIKLQINKFDFIPVWRDFNHIVLENEFFFFAVTFLI